MASMTMAASLIGVNVLPSSQTIRRRYSAIVAKASSSGEEVKLTCNTENKKSDESNVNGRRDMMFAAAAAAACSIAGVAFAVEPKRGTKEAKAKYAPVCVTMPTARICRN